MLVSHTPLCRRGISTHRLVRPNNSNTATSRIRAVGITFATLSRQNSSAADTRRDDTFKRPSSKSQPFEDVGTASIAQSSALASTATAGSLFGAIALITGSSVGAGMLALPAVTADAGLVPSCQALCLTWAVLTLEALLMAEVNLSVRDPSDDPDTIITLRQMAERTLGPAGKAVTVIYLLLSYSLLVAYLTKASEVFDFFAGHALPPPIASLALISGMATLLLGGGQEAADKLNQGLTSVLLVSFLGILAAGATQADVGAALMSSHGDYGALLGATPIMFLSLVYHDLVPFLCQYLDGDKSKIRSALVIGSLVPLAMFLSWEAVALGLLPNELAANPTAALQVALPLTSMIGSENAAAIAAAASLTTLVSPDNVDTVVNTVSTQVVDAAARLTIDPLEVFVRRSGPVVGTSVQVFSFLAVITSFIGTCLGLSETLRCEIPPLLGEAGKRLDDAFTSLSNALRAEQQLEQDQLAVGVDDDEIAQRLVSATSSSSIDTVDDTSGPLSALKRAVLLRFASTLDLDLTSSSDEDEICVVVDDVDECRRSWVDLNALTGAQGDDGGRAFALTLCLLPPLAFAAYNPGSFLAVLSVAGGYGMTLLYGLLPPMMAWKLREQNSSSSPVPSSIVGGGASSSSTAVPASGSEEEMVPGGKPVLAILFGMAAAVEVGRLLTDVGLMGH